MAALDIAAALTAALAVCVYHFLKPRTIPGIPHGSLNWFWGDLKGVVATAKAGHGEIHYFGEHAMKYGPVCQLLLGPSLPLVLVSDPKEVDDILRRRNADFEHSDRFNTSFAWTIPKAQISLRDSLMWRSHRRLMAPSMSPQYLSQMTPRISNNIQRFIDLWELKYALLQTRKDCVFDAIDDVQLFTMDNISDISFAETFGGLQGAIYLVKNLVSLPEPNDQGVVKFQFPDLPLHEAVRRLFEMMGDALKAPFPKLAYILYGFLSPSWRSARNQVYDLLAVRIAAQRKHVASRRANGDFKESADSVLEMVFEREGKDSPDSMPDDELVDELGLFLFGNGQDTTAGVLSWGLKYLTQHPRVQRKLRAELLRVYGIPEGSPRILSYDEINSGRSPYLEAVTSEILRLARVAPVLSRQAKRDTYILNYFIPKGTEIALLNGHVGLHDTVANLPLYTSLDPFRSKGSNLRETPQWQDDGQEFLPERWIDADGKFNPKMGSSYPFGGGLRACFGQKLAVLQLKLMFAYLNLSFFLDKLPHSALEGWEVNEVVTRQPRKAWVNLKKWDASFS